MCETDDILVNKRGEWRREQKLNLPIWNVDYTWPKPLYFLFSYSVLWISFWTSMDSVNDGNVHSVDTLSITELNKATGLWKQW